MHDHICPFPAEYRCQDVAHRIGDVQKTNDDHFIIIRRFGERLLHGYVEHIKRPKRNRCQVHSNEDSREAKVP